MEEKYSAGLISQSFWFVEFKKIVILYKNGADYGKIKRLCTEENLFRAVNPERGRRMCGYLLRRLRAMDEKIIDIFVNADVSTQKLINLITIMKTDKLFFEFVYEVYRNKLIVGDTNIDLKDVNIFFAQKETQSDEPASWTEQTKKKLRSLFLNMLTEAGLVKWADDKKQKRIVNRVFITMEFENYLKTTNMSMYKAIAGVN